MQVPLDKSKMQGEIFLICYFNNYPCSPISKSNVY